MVDRALAALAGNDGAALLAVAADAHERNADPEALLAQLLRALHRIAVLQTVPNASVERADALRPLATQLSPEDVQLYYQIGLVGQRDLPLAPDARTGLEMTLLRMLAFQPAATGAVSSPPRDRETTARPVVPGRGPAPMMAREPSPPTSPVSAVSSGPMSHSADAVAGPVWNALVGQLNLVGLARELAHNCVLESVEGQTWQLILDSACANLLGKERETALQQALASQLGHPVHLRITVGRPPTETPARVETHTALGLLPAGTANVWAQEMGLPALNWARWAALEEAASRLTAGVTHRVDVGWCNGNPFILWAGVGLDGFIVHRIEPRSRWEKSFSVFHYGASAIWYASQWRGLNMHVEVDGAVVEGHYLLVLASNIRLYAGGLIHLSSDNLLDDGAMEVWLIEGENMSDTLQRVWDLFASR